MQTLTICKANDCPMRRRCYRFTAKPGKQQKYFTPIGVKTNCEYFIENEA